MKRLEHTIKYCRKTEVREYFRVTNRYNYSLLLYLGYLYSKMKIKDKAYGYYEKAIISSRNDCYCMLETIHIEKSLTGNNNLKQARYFCVSEE